MARFPKLKLPSQEQAWWYAQVELSLKRCARAKKVEQWSLLAESSLAETPLILMLFPEQVKTTPRLLGLATYVTIQWALEQLKPQPTSSTAEIAWHDYAWRAYNVLYFLYFETLPIKDLAQRMTISEQTFFQSRRNAIQRVAALLAQEAMTGNALPMRQAAWYRLRYQCYTTSEQQILCLFAVLDLPPQIAEWQQLHQSTGAFTDETYTALITGLSVEGALVSAADTQFLRLPAALDQVLRREFSADLTAMHRTIANVRVTQGDFLAAADHLQRAGEHSRAVALLLAQQRTLVNDGYGEALFTRLQTFTPIQLDAEAWVQVKLLMGDLALQSHSVALALQEYEQALQSPIPLLKAQAYHRRARAFLSLNLDESLLHYEMAIKTLTAEDPHHPLLTRVQCDKAWLFIQEKSDLQQAQRLLQQIGETVSQFNRLGLSYLANAWAGFYHQRGEEELALQQRNHAWQLAQDAHDSEWLMHISRNLGNDYVEIRAYEQALRYFIQSSRFAQTIGDQPMVGLGEKAIGECHFWLGNPAQALRHYEKAYAILKATGRRNWLAYVCYDLAEYHAHAWDHKQLASYLAEGSALAHMLRNTQLSRMFLQLQESYAWLSRLNVRQQSALSYAKNQGLLTNRTYQQLTGCAQRQAVRDLNELCAWGLLQRSGRGRALQYILCT